VVLAGARFRAVPPDFGRGSSSSRSYLRARVPSPFGAAGFVPHCRSLAEAHRSGPPHSVRLRNAVPLKADLLLSRNRIPAGNGRLPGASVRRRFHFNFRSALRFIRGGKPRSVPYRSRRRRRSVGGSGDGTAPPAPGGAISMLCAAQFQTQSVLCPGKLRVRPKRCGACPGMRLRRSGQIADCGGGPRFGFSVGPGGSCRTGPLK
jgi:hypothetical protein